MDMQKFMDLVSDASKANRMSQGAQTLGFLKSALSLLDESMPIQWDTGTNFGIGGVIWKRQPPQEIRGPGYDFSHDGYDYVDSDYAYPSCYRGYYSDCTFNCSYGYPMSNVGFVLNNLIIPTIGKTFDGYKGGLNTFTEGTIVWGGESSHSSIGDSRFLSGIRINDGIVVLDTTQEDF